MQLESAGLDEGKIRDSPARGGGKTALLKKSPFGGWLVWALSEGGVY